MRELPRGRYSVESISIGPTELGSGTVVVDDEALVIVAPAADERPTRIRLVSIDAVVAGPRNVALELRDGTRVVFAGGPMSELRVALLDSCRALPEVTRTLRAFGSRRGHTSARASSAEEQHRFFAPLLLARRVASGALGPAEVVAAFDADALIRAFDAALHAFATERFSAHAPARRALEAELVDLAEPLRDALAALGAAAAQARGAIDDLSRWRAWAAQLHTTFEIADRVWLSLDVALAHRAPSTGKPAKRESLHPRAATPPRPPPRRRRT